MQKITPDFNDSQLAKLKKVYYGYDISKGIKHFIAITNNCSI